MKKIIKFIYINSFKSLINFYNLKSRHPIVAIVLYHRISNKRNYNNLGTITNIKIFENQIKFLKKNFEIISFKELDYQFNKNKISNKKQIIISFDDGYLDNYHNAFPIINSLSIKASLFIPVHYISKDEILWDCRLSNIFELNKEKIKKIILNKKTQFNLWYFINYFKKLSLDEINKRISFLKDEFKLVENNDINDFCLKWSHVEEMNKYGMEIGSHGMTHISLSNRDEDVLNKEILESKNIISSRLGDCSVFSYPFGSSNDFDQTSNDFIFNCDYSKILLNTQKINKINLNQKIFSRKAIDSYYDIKKIFS